MDNHKDKKKVSEPHKKYSNSLHFFEINMLQENLSEVNLTYSRKSHNIIMPLL
jgi:hypothetical protein